jgi:Na+/melibiose symporter-like transporter
MSSIYDTDDVLSAEEIEAVKQNARQRLSLWRSRGVYSTVALLLSCVLVYLFLEGSPLHAYWESFGKYLVLLSMALLLAFLYCTGLWWGAWRALRDLEQGQS